jgi:hypothetical protein
LRTLHAHNQGERCSDRRCSQAGSSDRAESPIRHNPSRPYAFEAQTAVNWRLGLSKIDPLVSKTSLVAGEITIVGSEVQVRIRNTDTKALRPSSSSRVYMHELEIIDPDGNKFSACIGTPTVFSTFDRLVQRIYFTLKTDHRFFERGKPRRRRLPILHRPPLFGRRSEQLLESAILDTA